jgi:hypothetical protein
MKRFKKNTLVKKLLLCGDSETSENSSPRVKRLLLKLVERICQDVAAIMQILKVKDCLLKEHLIGHSNQTFATLSSYFTGKLRDTI